MTTSPKSVLAISIFEGCRLTPYNDISGNATVGVGHLLHRGPCNGTEKSITHTGALELFAVDLHADAEVYVHAYVTVPLTQNQYDALVDFCYNLGCGTLHKLISETGLNASKYAAVPSQILTYDKAKVHGVEVRVGDLVKRREWEASLWNV